MDTGQQKALGSDLRESKSKQFDPYEGLSSLREGIFQATTQGGESKDTLQSC